MSHEPSPRERSLIDKQADEVFRCVRSRATRVQQGTGGYGISDEEDAEDQTTAYVGPRRVRLVRKVAGGCVICISASSLPLYHHVDKRIVMGQGRGQGMEDEVV